MKTLARILPVVAAIVAASGLVACSPSSPDASGPAAAATGRQPKWAFVEVGFQISREGKIMDVKVLASDAPEAVQK